MNITMAKFTIYYNPGLSSDCIQKIREHVTPSMVSLDETSAQYCISMITELLDSEIINDDDDIKLISKYIKDKINYLEF
jgi:hypothetical protein